MNSILIIGIAWIAGLLIGLYFGPDLSRWLYYRKLDRMPEEDAAYLSYVEFIDDPD